MTARRITATTPILRIKIQLLDVRPAVWRRIEIPGTATLADLHEAIQTVLGWTDSHLHEFEIDGRLFGSPDPDEDDDELIDDRSITLSAVARGGEHVRYVYDFGDNWRHTLIVEEVSAPEPGARYPRCLAGARACPPEDVGGPGGYQDFLAAIADPAHEEHGEYTEWGGGFDPTGFDLAVTNQALQPQVWTTQA